MGYHILDVAGRFPLLDSVIQEKIDQNCVDLCFGMLLQDLPPQQFNAPYTTTPKLNFPI